MKSAVIYYSLDGHTRLVADMVSRALDADVIELVPIKEFSKTGFKKFFWGGKSVFFNEKPKLKNSIPDLNGYDLIVIGTPVWASSCAPAVNTFISGAGLQGKKLAFFACHAGGGAEKCFDKMAKALGDNTLLGKIAFRDPTEDKSEEIRLQVKSWLAGFSL